MEAAEGLLERDEELGVLESHRAALQTGEGGLVVIKGPAGVGKTSLLRAFVRGERDRGSTLLRARGHQRESGIPYGVVRQLLDPVLASLDVSQRAALFTGAAGPARPLFEAAPPPSDAAGDPAARVRSLWWLILTLAEQEPITAVVDDLQWCDLESLQLLAFLAHRVEAVPVLLVSALRSGDHTEDDTLIADLLGQPHAVLLHPRPLTDASTRRLIVEAFGAATTDTAVSTCQSLAGGNPLLLQELLRALAREGATTDLTAAALRRVGSDALTTLLRQRLAALPTEARLLARTLAVLGEGTSLPLVAEIAGLGAEAAEDAAERLREAEVLRSTVAVEFAHPLLAEAAYRSMSDRERVEAHIAAAAELRRRRAALHQIAAQVSLIPPGRFDDAAPLLREAARAALGSGARHSAVAYLRRAVAEPLDDTVRAELLAELGITETFIDGEQAVRHLREAIDLTTDSQRRAALATILGPALGFTQRNAEAVTVYEQALTALPAAADRSLRDQLEAGLLAASVDDARLYPSARPHADRWNTVPPDDLPPLLAAVLAWHEARTGGTTARCVALAEHALHASTGPDQTATFSYAGLVLAVADRHEDARALCNRTLERARSTGSVFEFAIASWLRGIVAYLQGDLDDAQADQRQAIDAGEEHGLSAGLPYAYARLADALIDRGDLTGADGALAQVPVPDPPPPLAHFDWWLHTRGRLRLAQGRATEALHDLTEAGRRYQALDGVNPAFIPWQSEAALAHLALGHAQTARDLADAEVDRARTWGAPRGVARALRIAAETRPPRQALPLLRESHDLLSTVGARLERARTAVTLGSTLTRLGETSAARDALRTALDEAIHCGAEPLARRAHDELIHTGARPRHMTTSGTAALTPTERRVAVLAAEGHTNREIAERLFVTPKTIEMHLGNVFRKLHVEGRGQLSRLLSGA